MIFEDEMEKFSLALDIRIGFSSARICAGRPIFRRKIAILSHWANLVDILMIGWLNLIHIPLFD